MAVLRARSPMEEALNSGASRVRWASGSGLSSRPDTCRRRARCAGSHRRWPQRRPRRCPSDHLLRHLAQKRVMICTERNSDGRGPATPRARSMSAGSWSAMLWQTSRSQGPSAPCGGAEDAASFPDDVAQSFALLPRRGRRSCRPRRSGTCRSCRRPFGGGMTTTPSTQQSCHVPSHLGSGSGGGQAP